MHRCPVRRRDDAPETTGTLETLGSGCAFAYTLVYTLCGCGSDGTTCPRRSPRDFRVVLQLVQRLFAERGDVKMGTFEGQYRIRAGRWGSNILPGTHAPPYCVSLHPHGRPGRQR